MLYNRTFLFVHSIHNSLRLLISTSTPSLLQTPPHWQPQVYSLCLWVFWVFFYFYKIEIFCFYFYYLFSIDRFICVIFWIPHISDMILVLFLTYSLSMIISSFIHVAANGIISFFFMAKWNSTCGTPSLSTHLEINIWVVSLAVVNSAKALPLK